MDKPYRGALPIGSELAVASLIMQAEAQHDVIMAPSRTGMSEPVLARNEGDCQSCDDEGDCTSGEQCVALSNPPADLMTVTQAPEGSFPLAGHGVYVPRVRAIVQDPDPVLRAVCSPIDFDNEQHMAALPFLVADLRATLRASRTGVGLAANQIGVRARLIIVDRSNNGVDEYVMVNPEIIERSKDSQRVPDGCLSVQYGRKRLATKRAKRIRVRWRNVNGEPLVMKFQGLMAAIIQHEVDHLNGILFTDVPGVP